MVAQGVCGCGKPGCDGNCKCGRDGSNVDGGENCDCGGICACSVMEAKGSCPAKMGEKVKDKIRADQAAIFTQSGTVPIGIGGHVFFGENYERSEKMSFRDEGQRLAQFG